MLRHCPRSRSKTSSRKELFAYAKLMYKTSKCQFSKRILKSAYFVTFHASILYLRDIYVYTFKKLLVSAFKKLKLK